jgi:hypothetical protein
VLIAVKNAKFRLNLTQTGPFIAENVGKKEDLPEEGDIKLSRSHLT